MNTIIQFVKPVRYSRKTGAMALGISERGFDALVRRENIPSYPDGGKVFFLPEDLEAYQERVMNRKENKAAA